MLQLLEKFEQSNIIFTRGVGLCERAKGNRITANNYARIREMKIPAIRNRLGPTCTLYWVFLTNI